MRLFFHVVIAAIAFCIDWPLVRSMVFETGVPVSDLINGHASTLKPRGNANLKIAIKNNFPDVGDGEFNAYVTGTDPGDATSYRFLTANHTWYIGDKTGATKDKNIPIDPNLIKIPLHATDKWTNVTLPYYLKSARVFIAHGELQFAMATTGRADPTVVAPSDDPNNAYNKRWGFVEFDDSEAEVYTNLSFVDWVGLVLGLGIEHSGPDGITTDWIKGLQPDAVKDICDELEKEELENHQMWSKLCIKDGSGNPLRILSPNIYATIPGLDHTEWIRYYDPYIENVWTTYTGKDLHMNTQDNGHGLPTPFGTAYTCRVHTDDHMLHCLGGPDQVAPIEKPTSLDVWGCNSGAFINDPSENNSTQEVRTRLCAAFTRSTLLLPGGDTQPSEQIGKDLYYTETPTNQYSKLVHTHLQDGRGYAFAYDDVNPNNDDNAAGVLRSPTPDALIITFGK